jgi:hypothetical protein
VNITGLDRLHGSLSLLKVITDRQTGKSRGYGFVSRNLTKEKIDWKHASSVVKDNRFSSFSLSRLSSPNHQSLSMMFSQLY